MAATLRDVARVAGVSFKTVSNVINDYPHISAVTRAKVLAAIEQLDYRPNRHARSLRSGRMGAIGLAVPELSLSYFAELADEVIRAASAHDVVVLIEQTGGDRAREIEILSSPQRQLTDGLLFSALGMNPEDGALLEVDYPLVLLGEQILDGPADHVTMQNVEGARAATEHLLAMGRRRIVLLGEHHGESIGSSRLRAQGYREALAAAGLPEDPRLVAPADPWHRANGAESMRDFLATGTPFDAVFAMNDELALGALRVMHEAGLEVPRDVALIGFDDIDEAQYAAPSLSTVDPGRKEIAQLAVELLWSRIDAADARGPQLLRSQFRVKARESTAGAPSPL